MHRCGPVKCIYPRKLHSKLVIVEVLTVPRWCFFCGSFLLFMFLVCYAFLYVHCSVVVTYWERANLLALFYVMFSCIFVTFPYSVLGQVWYFMVSIPGMCFVVCL